MKLKLITLFTFIVISGASSQTLPVPANSPNHPRVFMHRYSAWFEANPSGLITQDKRWLWQVDYQYRRMSDASFVPNGQHGNIFKDPYQQVVRPWIHYWLIPGSVRLSLSPLGYWATWTPPQEGRGGPAATPYVTPAGNVGKTFFPEFRTCPQITLYQTIGRVQIQNRFRYEFRWIGQRHASSFNLQDFGYGYDFGTNTFGSSNQGRLRYQFRVQVPLNNKKIDKKTWYINAWDEVFLGIGRHVGVNKTLNQNRVVALLGYRLNTEVPIKIEAGVTYQTVFTSPYANTTEINTAYTVYLVIDEFGKLFKTKKDKQTDNLPAEVK